MEAGSSLKGEGEDEAGSEDEIGALAGDVVGGTPGDKALIDGDEDFAETPASGEPQLPGRPASAGRRRAPSRDALSLSTLGLAWARLPAGRPLVLALAAASVTLNVTEAFPVNLVLGLLLACRGG